MNRLLLVLFFFSCNAWGAEESDSWGTSIFHNLLKDIEDGQVPPNADGEWVCIHHPTKGPQSFTKRDSFRQHVRHVHLGIKDAQCDACGKWFAKNSSCKRHQQNGSCRGATDDDKSDPDD